MRNRIAATVRSLRARRHGNKTANHLAAIKKHAQRTIEHLDELYDVNTDRITGHYDQIGRIAAEQRSIDEEQQLGQALLSALKPFQIDGTPKNA